MRRAVIVIGVMVLAAVAATEPAGATGFVRLESPARSSAYASCTYDVGQGDVVGAYLPDPFGVSGDGNINVGACEFDLTGLGFSAIAMDVNPWDTVFGWDVGGLVCTDLNEDGFCGDVGLGEMSEVFCGPTSGIPLQPWTGASSVWVFVYGPLGQLQCGSSNAVGATSGFLEVNFVGEDTGGCTWKSRAMHASITTIGAGWGTSVEMFMSYLWGCPGGPLIFDGSGSCSAPLYYTITACGADPPAGAGLGIRGTFSCNAPATCGGLDHDLSEQVVVDNFGGAACIAQHPGAAPGADHHCHVH